MVPSLVTILRPEVCMISLPDPPPPLLPTSCRMAGDLALAISLKNICIPKRLYPDTQGDMVIESHQHQITIAIRSRMLHVTGGGDNFE